MSARAVPALVAVVLLALLAIPGRPADAALSSSRAPAGIAAAPPSAASAASAAASPRAAAGPRVVGGAAGPAIPWQVALVPANAGAVVTPLRVFCGGVLRDAWHVLTAAHCVADVDASSVAVAAFPGTRSAPGPGAEVRPLQGITTPPAFRASTEGLDVALLTLAAPVSGAPLPLPAPGQDDTGSAALVSGWGDADPVSPGAQQPDALLRGVVRVLPDARCALYGAYFRAETMLCAGATGPGVVADACQGDSGGPLVRHDGGPVGPDGVTDLGHYDRVVGLVSWGVSCGDARLPGVYTRLAAPAVQAVAAAPSPPFRPDATGPAPSVEGLLAPGQTAHCAPGRWSVDALTREYTWRSAGSTGDVRVEGVGPDLPLGAAHVGRVLACEERVSSPGGTRTRSSGARHPVAATLEQARQLAAAEGRETGSPRAVDLAAPTAAITRGRCRAGRCALAVVARQSSRPAKAVRVTYARTSGCPRRGAARRRCAAPRTLRVARVSGGVFRGTTARLPRARWRFVAVATGTAKLRSRKAVRVLRVAR